MKHEHPNRACNGRQMILANPSGKTITRPAEYQITLTPNIAVVSSDP
ncbi:MAG: hypothetical protein U0929_15500 [Planctomycetaceae bacterium]